MKRILLIDDDRDTVDRVSAFVGGTSSVPGGGAYQLQSATDVDTALHRVRAWKPHVILLGLGAPAVASSADAAAASGLASFIGRIRAASVEDYAAILVLHADLTSRPVRQALEASADDALALPLSEPALALRLPMLARLKELHDSIRRANHRLDEMANTDEVTGLLNLRAIIRRGDEEIDRSSRFHKPVSALLLNLDGFSVVNRDHGFTYGNFVLHETARRIRTCLRNIDFAGRVGGDEFFVFLKETDLSEAEFVAERVRQAIRSDAFRSDKVSCDLTTSIGVGGFVPAPDQPRAMKELLHITFEASRSAKAAGTDQIEIYSFG